MINKPREVNISAIKEYVLMIKKQTSLNLIPERATCVKFYGLRKYNATVNDVYSFTVSFVRNGIRHTSDFILKIYTNKETCEKEYNVLRFLERKKFPVPHVFAKGSNRSFFDSPFLLMEKIDGKSLKDYIKHASMKELFNIIEKFAETLAYLHEIPPDKTELKIDYPKDEYEYAERQTLWKNELPRYVNKSGFECVSRWLTLNARKNPCNHFSLVRRDMNLGNFIVTDKNEIVMLDWEWAEIGDPLIDVAYAYHNIRHAFSIRNIDRKGAKLARYFIQKYFEKSRKVPNPSSVKYYLIYSALREAIYLRYVKDQVFSLSFIKKYGLKYLPFIPYIWWRYRSRYKHLERYLRAEVANYEEAMFRTVGAKVLSKMEINKILELLGAKPFELILDVGAGSGRITREVIRTNANVIAVDVERKAAQSIKMGKQLNGDYAIVIADGQHLPFINDCFDGIICIRTLKYFQNPLLGISEFSRTLKLHGRLIIDFSSIFGYESLLRYFTPVKSARKAHVFNFFEIKELVKNYDLVIVEARPLQKIPHNFWNVTSNLRMLRLFCICENLLNKITPSIFSRSILVKCIKCGKKSKNKR